MQSQFVIPKNYICLLLCIILPIGVITYNLYHHLGFSGTITFWELCSSQIWNRVYVRAKFLNQTIYYTLYIVECLYKVWKCSILILYIPYMLYNVYRLSLQRYPACILNMFRYTLVQKLHNVKSKRKWNGVWSRTISVSDINEPIPWYIVCL